jgi:hypothetical protein
MNASRGRLIVGFLILLALLATGDSILHFRGIYRLLVEWQLDYADHYYAGYTGAFTFMLYAAAVALLGAALVRLGILPAKTSMEGVSDWRQKLRAATPWLRERKYRVALGGAAVFLIFSGLCDALVGFSAGTLQSVSLAQIEKGAPVDGRWIDLLDAQAWIDRSITLGQTSATADFTQYTPVVPNEAQPGAKVAVFLKHRRSSFDPSAALPPMSGIVSYLPLSAFVHSEFEKHGVPVADQTWVVDWGDSPSSAILSGVIDTGLGLLLLVGTALVWLLKSRSAAKNQGAG